MKLAYFYLYRIFICITNIVLLELILLGNMRKNVITLGFASFRPNGMIKPTPIRLTLADEIPGRRQRQVFYSGSQNISVGYLLCRPPRILPDLHPLEQNYSTLLENEYNLYSRHHSRIMSGAPPSSFANKDNPAEASQNFWKNRGLSLDAWQRDIASSGLPAYRKGPKASEAQPNPNADSKESAAAKLRALKDNFYNMDTYQEVHRLMINTWEPPSRRTEMDFCSLLDIYNGGRNASEKLITKTGQENKENNEPEKIASYDAPESSDAKLMHDYAHSTDRCLDRHLYFIIGHEVKHEEVKTNQTDEYLPSERSETQIQWSVPYVNRVDGESLRMSLDRALHTHHSELMETYVYSNAPVGVLRKKDPTNAEKTTEHIYIFHASLLDGNPVIDFIQPRPARWAWVTRDELRMYFDKEVEMKSLLLDVTL